MAFSLQQFVAIRPYLYHFTSLDNLPNIRKKPRLSSAHSLASEAGHSKIQRKRECRMRLNGGATIYLQTQAPLHKRNIEFEDGWSFEALIERLNGLVFFWPGSEDGPIDYGERHRKGNDWKSEVSAIRIPSRELLRDGVSPQPLFCPYNSGSPRCSGGLKSPRGARTFLPAFSFKRTASKVIEVVFEDGIDLPDFTQIRPTATSDWCSIGSPERHGTL